MTVAFEMMSNGNVFYYYNDKNYFLFIYKAKASKSTHHKNFDKCAKERKISPQEGIIAQTRVYDIGEK